MFNQKLFDELWATYPPTQHRQEWEEFLQIMYQRRPKRILEIGNERGHSTVHLMRLLKPEIMVTVDMPGLEPGFVYEDLRTRLLNDNKQTTQLVEFLRNSHDENLALELIQFCATNGKFDLIFIDANHRFGDVCQDFALALGLINPNGVIALHDIALHTHLPYADQQYSGEAGVYRLWNFIQTSPLAHESLIYSHIGIGLVYM